MLSFFCNFWIFEKTTRIKRLDARAKVNDLQIEYYLHEFTFSVVILLKYKVYECKGKLPKVYYFISTCDIQNGENHMLEHNKLRDEYTISNS